MPATSSLRPLLTDQQDQKERQDKLAAFLFREMARKEHRQCVQVELLYSPGMGFHDEPIHAWTRDEDPKLLEDLSGVEPLVSAIFQIANDAMAHKPAGKHRFVVRTHQHLESKPAHSFALYPPYNDEDVSPVDRRSGQQDPRACLLVRVAGDVANGLVQRSDPSVAPDAVATLAVNIAEAILKKAGL